MRRRRLSVGGRVLACLPSWTIVIGAAAIVVVPRIAVAFLAIAIRASGVVVVDKGWCGVLSITGLRPAICVFVRIFLSLKEVPSLAC